MVLPLLVRRDPEVYGSVLATEHLRDRAATERPRPHPPCSDSSSVSARQLLDLRQQAVRVESLVGHLLAEAAAALAVRSRDTKVRRFPMLAAGNVLEG